MANSQRGEVELELAGTPYTLAFNFNAIAEIETAFGDRSIDSIFFGGQLSRRAIIEAIRAGLVKRNRRHTSKQVAEMLDATVADDPTAYARVVRTVVLGLMAANGVGQAKLDEASAALDAEMKSNSPAEVAAVPPPPAPVIGAV